MNNMVEKSEKSGEKTVTDVRKGKTKEKSLPS